MFFMIVRIAIGIIFPHGAVGRDRTGDLRVTNALLYRLSYNGVPGKDYSIFALTA